MDAQRIEHERPLVAVKSEHGLGIHALQGVSHGGLAVLAVLEVESEELLERDAVELLDELVEEEELVDEVRSLSCLNCLRQSCRAPSDWMTCQTA